MSRFITFAVVLALGCGGGGGGSGPPDGGPSEDTGRAIPPMRCFFDRLDLVRGQLGAAGCFVTDSGGEVRTVTVASPPAGLSFEYVPEPPTTSGRIYGNLRVTVEADAPLVDAFVEVGLHGPGGDATQVLEVGVHEPEGSGIVVGTGAVEVALTGGEAREVPVRVVSFGGFRGEVALFGPSATGREVGAWLDRTGGSVAPDMPFDTTVTVEGRYAELGGGETIRVQAASLRAHAEAELRYTLDPTPERVDVWTSLGAGPLVLRPGETAELSFDVQSSGTLGPELALTAVAPAGYTAEIVPGVTGQLLRVAASASAPEGGADVVVTASLGDARWSGTVRVVRPPTSGAFRFVGDGPLPSDSAEVLDRGVERRLARRASAGATSGLGPDGLEWSLAPAGTTVAILRGGGNFATLDLAGRSYLEGALTVPSDGLPFVLATAGTTLRGQHLLGGSAPTWEPLPSIEANDGHEPRPLAIASRDGQLAVLLGQETPTITASGPSGLLAYVLEGGSFRGPFFAPGTVLRADTTGEAQLAVGLDSMGRPVVAWIDPADERVHVGTLDPAGSSLTTLDPTPGRIVVGVDLLVTADDRALVLVHEDADLHGASHPGVGAGARLRVLEVGGGGASWEVPLPDLQSRPTVAALGLGAGGAPRAVLSDAAGVWVADPR